MTGFFRLVLSIWQRRTVASVPGGGIRLAALAFVQVTMRHSALHLPIKRALIHSFGFDVKTGPAMSVKFVLVFWI
jgi:hypothetical protein